MNKNFSKLIATVLSISSLCGSCKASTFSDVDELKVNNSKKIASLCKIAGGSSLLAIIISKTIFGNRNKTDLNNSGNDRREPLGETTNVNIQGPKWNIRIGKYKESDDDLGKIAVWIDLDVRKGAEFMEKRNLVRMLLEEAVRGYPKNGDSATFSSYGAGAFETLELSDTPENEISVRDSIIQTCINNGIGTGNIRFDLHRFRDAN